MLLALGELVVGSPGHDVEGEHLEGVVVDHGPEGAGGEDVGVHGVDVVGVHAVGIELLHHPRHPVLLDVGDGEAGPLAVEELAEVVAHVPDPLHRHVLVVEAVVAVAELGGGLDSVVDPPGRHRRRVAGAPVDPHDMLGLHADPLHVVGGGPHVLGGDVAAPQGGHGPAMATEDHLAMVRVGVADDHRLPSSQVQPGHRGLVRHPPGEPEHVHHRLLLAPVVPEARPAQGRPQGGVVDGDDPPVPELRLVPEGKLLVTPLRHRLEDFHPFPLPAGDGTFPSCVAPPSGPLSRVGFHPDLL